MDLAEGWTKLEPQEKIIVFHLLSIRRSVEVFEDLQLAEQAHRLLS